MSLWKWKKHVDMVRSLIFVCVLWLSTDCECVVMLLNIKEIRNEIALVFYLSNFNSKYLWHLCGKILRNIQHFDVRTHLKKINSYSWNIIYSRPRTWEEIQLLTLLKVLQFNYLNHFTSSLFLKSEINDVSKWDWLLSILVTNYFFNVVRSMIRILWLLHYFHFVLN